MLRFAPLLPLLLCSSALAAPIPKAKVKDSEAVLGQWTVVELLRNGNVLDKGLAGAVATIGKDALTIAVPKQTPDDVLAYRLDAEEKHIDLTQLNPDPGPTMKGLYELDGDTLFIAVGSERPSVAKGGPGIVFFKLRRIKEEKK